MADKTFQLVTKEVVRVELTVPELREEIIKSYIERARAGGFKRLEFIFGESYTKVSFAITITT